MPGTTPIYGWRYPLWNENIAQPQFQTMATDIDTTWGTFDTKVTAARTLPRLFITGTTATPVVNVETTLNFTTEKIDTGNWFSSGVSTTNVNLPAGVFYVSLSCALVTSNTRNGYRATINIGGTPVLREKTALSTVVLPGTFSAPEQPMCVVGEIFVTAPAVLTASFLFNGTGVSVNSTQQLFIQQVRTTLP